MKEILVSIIVLLLFSHANSQGTALRNLDINLENYQYPYPVKFITVHDQEQDLQMAYMDVKPANYNGKNL